MKAAIIGMVSNVGKSTSHHGGGYHHILVRMMQDMWPHKEFTVNPDPQTWSDYAELYTLEGVNYAENVFNFMGGPQPEHKSKLEAIAKFQGPIFNVDVPLDFNIFNKRIKLDHHFASATTIQVTKGYAEVQRKAVIGDSHSLSAWRPGFGLRRSDGKTLHGFLNLAVVDKINSVYDETITYFGNIDLRFHLMRQPDPKAATVELFTKYAEFSNSLKNNTVIGLLPVENESRKLPGTGLYKGQKFFGTRAERMELREIAHATLKSAGIKVLEWPESWVDADGTAMFEYMEPKQSVHLKPKYYMFSQLFIN
jgi:hypothetical protein